jgi:hypothetical protein
LEYSPFAVRTATKGPPVVNTAGAFPEIVQEGIHRRFYRRDDLADAIC